MSWEIHKQYDNDPRLNGKRRLIRDHMDNGETHVVASNIRPENVALLHAAPDMLAALRDVLEILRDSWGDEQIERGDDQAANIIRAILTRIDGDSTDAA